MLTVSSGFATAPSSWPSKGNWFAAFPLELLDFEVLILAQVKSSDTSFFHLFRVEMSLKLTWTLFPVVSSGVQQLVSTNSLPRSGQTVGSSLRRFLQ